MPPAPALVAALLAFAAADITSTETSDASKRSIKSLASGPGSIGAGCLFEGAWTREGGAVTTGAACLRCACRHGALTCRRRACAPLPDPPPHRCHVLHRKTACCPELHCPDGVTLMEQEASARLDDEDIAAPASISHVYPACVEGGTVYAAGSAMRAARPCESCFCLGGARRCVRPRCLPAPPGCRARPQPGVCCPQRYYCEHDPPPEHKHTHDCKVGNEWVPEGERVVSTNSSECSQCYCLRGSVQCQAQACAPPLLGCKPLRRAGDCCAHQYRCEHNTHGSHIVTLSNNVLSPMRIDDRAFHSLNKLDSTTKTILADVYTVSNVTATRNHLVSTTKVKRKTSDPPPEISSASPAHSTTVIPKSTMTTTQVPTTVIQLTSTIMAKLIATTEAVETTSQSPATFTAELTTEATSTEQPEGSVRITVNGTINCTAELSSTSLPLNMTFNDTERINMESHPRVPLIDVSNLEDHTFSANDIITDRTINGGFDENESFVINVTSSLNANTNNSHVTKVPLHTVALSAVAGSVDANNSSKKTKGDYDFDYTEPTLPPSLPNLKIIPFVAADAVVEDNHPKEIMTYPNIEREDKFPVYYPSVDTKEAYATRRQEVYRPTQYPVFITDKPDHEQYPSLTPNIDLTNSGFSDIHADVDSSINEYTVSSNVGSRVPDVTSTTQPPLPTTTFKLKTPVVNLFSPPVETEGGFLPKGPTGLIDEYFAVFPSTPGPAVPHLTTSMQLDIVKGECVSSDGRRVAEGSSIVLSCSECTCAWGELHCSPRACPTPAGCRRRPAAANAADLCCGELICDEDNKSTQTTEVSTTKLVTEATELKLTTEASNLLNELIKKKNQEKPINDTINIDVPVKKIENISQSQNAAANSSRHESDKNKNQTISTTTKELLTKPITTTTPASLQSSTTESNNQSLEYEEDEDEGFSFGSVLKLLLSDNYETTTTPPKRMPTTTRNPALVRTTTTTRRPRPTLPPVQPPKPSISPFVPLPVHSYIPSKLNQNPINRIDHLVLGEATAIKKTTFRPITTTYHPMTTTRPTNRPTTPHLIAKPTELTIEEGYSTQDSPRPPGGLPGLGPSLLKLAGCNIYGRMYRVGRIITELSTPCQECWCTEFGVQCKQLKC